MRRTLILVAVALGCGLAVLAGPRPAQAHPLGNFSVNQLVQDVAAIVQPLLSKNGNQLVVTCPDDIGTMHADLTKVRQTLFNLLSNAVKFTENGRIELRVASYELREERDEGDAEGG